MADVVADKLDEDTLAATRSAFTVNSGKTSRCLQVSGAAASHEPIF
jgi:hypothetical protein